jgi:non-specific serine/threonine protein kinase/serine/threonine-protein kinase
VLLHVLITGRTPYRLQVGSHAELRHQLASATVSPASAAMDQRLRDAGERAAARRSTPTAIARRLRGDIDAIVRRALARDVDSRYQSIDQLIDELDRHRTHHPVAARGTDWAYLTHAFVKRHRLAITVAGAFLLVGAIGIAGVLWQASIAADARARAERRFEDVRHLARSFIFDVDNEIVNVPGTTRARALMMRTASEYLDGLAREAHGDVGLQRELASAYVRVGDAQGHPTSANVGDTAGARTSYQRAIDISTAILAMDASDVDAERTRAMAHRRLSDVLAWAGDTTAALTHCDTSYRLFVAVASRPGATAEDRLQEAIAELKVGDLLGNPNLPNLRKPADARVRYDAALISLRTLAASTPGDQRVTRYLGLILERLGTMHELGRDWAAAAAAYQESFTLRQALAATPPVQQDVQRDLAIAYEKLGNVQLASGDEAAAETSYRGALSEFERLANADPSNAIAARSVAISREKVAGTVAPQGRSDEAVRLLESALAIHVRLANSDSANAQARCDSARLKEALGDTWRASAGTAGPTACTYWRDSLQARRELRSNAVACVTEEDAAHVAAKVRHCQY